MLRAAFVMILALTGMLEAQGTLEITSPEEGTVVNPGHVVGVTVSSPGVLVTDVAVMGWDPIPTSKMLASPPYQFDIEIPAQITPGRYLLTALGKTNSGQLIESEPLSIDVERPDLPQKIAANFRQLDLIVGDQVHIGVQGTYADGSVVDLSKSTQTAFTSQSPAIATVTPEGLVTAVAPGSTQVVVDGRLVVPITVEPFIRITPEKATLKASETREFVARVTHPPNGKVQWTLNPNIGSVVDGLYTAPASLQSQQTVALTAASIDNPAFMATAVITLNPVVSIDVTPSWAVLYMAQTRRFQASAVNAGPKEVKWSISPPNAGTISSTGLYTAPSTIATTQAVKIIATSVANPAISGSTTIYISPRPFKIFLFPTGLTLAPGESTGTLVTLLATDRFLHPIALSVEGAPIGIKATLSDTTLTGNSMALLKLIYENETVPASYNIVVKAQDTVYPALIDSQTLTLNVEAGPH